MRRTAWIPTCLAALTIGVAANAQQTSHQQQYCGALASLTTHIAALGAMGPNTTVGQVRANASRVEQDAENVKSAAGKMKTPAADSFNESAKKLHQDRQSIPNDATVEQARSSLRTDLDDLKSNAQTLATESGCPQAAKP